MKFKVGHFVTVGIYKGYFEITSIEGDKYILKHLTGFCLYVEESELSMYYGALEDRHRGGGDFVKIDEPDYGSQARIYKKMIDSMGVAPHEFKTEYECEYIDESNAGKTAKEIKMSDITRKLNGFKKNTEYSQDVYEEKTFVLDLYTLIKDYKMIKGSGFGTEGILTSFTVENNDTVTMVIREGDVTKEEVE